MESDLNWTPSVIDEGSVHLTYKGDNPHEYLLYHSIQKVKPFVMIVRGRLLDDIQKSDLIRAFYKMAMEEYEKE